MKNKTHKIFIAALVVFWVAIGIAAIFTPDNHTHLDVTHLVQGAECP